MNFEQAREYSFLVPWKATECFSGPECWCRMIVPIEPIKYDEYCKNVGATIYREYDVIVDAAAIDKETAEYIVRLHNLYITRETVLNLTEEQKENFKKEWDILNTGPRSIGWDNKNSKSRTINRDEID